MCGAGLLEGEGCGEEAAGPPEEEETHVSVTLNTPAQPPAPGREELEMPQMGCSSRQEQRKKENEEKKKG